MRAKEGDEMRTHVRGSTIWRGMTVRNWVLPSFGAAAVGDGVEVLKWLVVGQRMRAATGAVWGLAKAAV